MLVATSLFAFLTIPALSRAQQPISQPNSSPLGIKYSASTDVSHISFNSPLVKYGSDLEEIRLPAAPIQPANLKLAPQKDEEQQLAAQTLANNGNPRLQQQQLPIDVDQQQQQQKFISIQQYPHNPQYQNAQQNLDLSQNLPIAQYQQQAAPQQYPVQQQFPTAFQQQPYAVPVAQRPFPTAFQQQQQQQPTVYTNNGYFATGPFASRYAQQPNLFDGQQNFPRYVSNVQPHVQLQPTAPLVSRVAFNGPTTGFSYGF